MTMARIIYLHIVEELRKIVLKRLDATAQMIMKIVTGRTQQIMQMIVVYAGEIFILMRTVSQNLLATKTMKFRKK